MASIKNITAREILDSRGNPTVEAEMVLSDGTIGRASVPSGASTGKYEAVELRDGNKGRYGGKGVRNAIGNIGTVIAPALIGKSFTQSVLDNTLINLDGTPNKSKLGANAILAVSLSFAHASAKSANVPLWKYFNTISYGTKVSLPTLMMNIINGGKHAPGGVDIQEFMIVPLNRSIAESLRAGAEIYHTLKRLLSEKKSSTLTGDEGGFAPALSSNEQAFELLVSAIKDAGYAPGTAAQIGIDAAASSFFYGNTYIFRSDDKKLTADELLKLYEHWSERFPLFSIEDPFAEDSWEDFKKITASLGKKIKIVGDDLFVTNSERLHKGIIEKAANAIIVKPNQIGTVTETIEVVKAAKKARFTCIASHRSGETEDVSIAHLAVGLGIGFIKTGAPASGERTAKYNELMRIEEQFNSKI